MFLSFVTAHLPAVFNISESRDVARLALADGNPYKIGAYKNERKASE
jgi:hypothetical protein